MRCPCVEGEGEHIVADLPTDQLGTWLDRAAGAIGRGLLTKGTNQDALTARELFGKAVDHPDPESAPFGCIPAVWVCLYAPPLIPGAGLTMDDLRAAAGEGTVLISVSQDRCTSRDRQPGTTTTTGDNTGTGGMTGGGIGSGGTGGTTGGGMTGGGIGSGR
jgi:hypothetical protein